MLKVAVLAGGGGTNLQAIIDAHKAGKLPDTELSFVLSNKPDAYALVRARDYGIEQVVVDSASFSRAQFEEKLMDEIEKRQPDLIVLAGLMIMIPKELCRKYKNRIINIHPSLIPSFCGKGFYGLKVHEAALKKGVKVTGATVHFVDEIYDNGPIIIQKAVEVKDGDTPEILQRRVMEEAEWKILPEAIRLIACGSVSVLDGVVKIQN
ncbi:MAG: phosphoribosylglycinamide formyltransferase [Lachnospiraceae bacterium]|nr:phosphoribosylglycinamide formyltransferase [Lachnospiraceae bacterium]MBR4174559.1 phosphoribosylglycinamide formyltransferase [Lachnospiraceae bacterium]